jgi:hypothetical protein
MLAKGKIMIQRVESILAVRLRAILAPAVPVIVATLFAGSAHADTLTLYATTFNENQLLQINLGTGAGTQVGVIADGLTADLASNGGNLYALDQMNLVFNRINPSTAGTSSSTTLGIAIAGEGGFTFDGSGNAIVSASQGSTGQLFGCNVTVNNGCSAIDGPGALTPSMDGLAINGAGVLYGMSQSPVGDASPSLYTINKATGAVSIIGSTGQTGNDLGGLAFDPLNGVLYSAFNGELYTINTSTGAATAVGAIGFNDISGLAFLSSGSSSVPEPGTTGILALGMLLSLIARRRISSKLS